MPDLPSGLFYFDPDCPDYNAATETDESPAWFEDHAKTCKYCKKYNKTDGEKLRKQDKELDAAMMEMYREASQKKP